jgi:sec-independent protein translocase protein TatA
LGVVRQLKVAIRAGLRDGRESIRMGELFTPTHMIVLAVLAIVLFGGRKLPELGKGLGEGLKGFKEGLKGISDEPNVNTKPGETAHIVTPKPDETPKA